MSDQLPPVIQFQPIIAATFAFLGGIIALVGNAWFARRRDDRTRARETDAVAACLYGEIVLIRRAIAEVAQVTAGTLRQVEMGNTHIKFDAHFLERAKLPSPLLYEALAEKIGNLPPEWVLRITEFYGNLESMRQWLPRFVDSQHQSVTYSVTVVLQPARDAVFDIKPTLQAIERHLRIRTSAIDPEFGKADQTLNEEEARWQLTLGND